MRLNEIVNADTVVLSNIQLLVLLTIKLSATPEVAYENINGVDNLTEATDMLYKFGFIKLFGNKASLSEKGEGAIIQYNLLDTEGKITNKGKAILNLPVKTRDQRMDQGKQDLNQAV